MNEKIGATYRRNPDWLWPIVTGTAGKALVERGGQP